MCLIITTFAAICASLFWLFKDKDNAHKSGMLALMYWGASLMWLVDCIFAVFQGEAFLDTSNNDAILGVIIVICGLLAYFIIRKLNLFDTSSL